MVFPIGNPHLQAVLFDLGETLLNPGGGSPSFVRDQAERNYRAVYDYLLGRGKPLPEWDAFYERNLTVFQATRKASFCDHTSVHIGDTIEAACSELGISLTPSERKRCVRLTYEYSDEQAALYPEVIPLLERLRSEGLATGLISNTIWPGWCHDETLDRLGVRELLEPRIFSADTPFTKPHPGIFAQALNQLGIEAPSAVYVGDHLDPDILGPQRAGMKGILYRVPYRTEKHPRITPDDSVTSLAQVPEALARLYPSYSQKGQDR